MIREGVFKHQCSSCTRVDWLGKAIPLELDHINGVRTDNRLENLRLLCPNCHTLTSTYRGRKKIKSKRGKVTKKKLKKEKPKIFCSGCGKEGTKRCRRCCHIARRIVVRPAVAVLLIDIQNLGYSGTGRKYGVSHTTIRDWVKFG